MNPILIIAVVVFLIGVLAAIFAAMTSFKRQVKDDILSSQQQFLELLKKQSEIDQSKTISEFELRKQAVESSVKGLKEELERYQKLLREFEEDRTRKFGHIENELKNASQATVKLQESTNHLNNILGNVKLRGQWGERMAEDIIRYAGLLEGVNYIKQTKLSSSTTKPDFTFLLPNDHKINMDVKFPLDNYLQMVNASSPDERERFAKEFIKNVKDRIKEIQNRDYINPAENTLDFVLLFIPNEQVFGLIQEKYPSLTDEAIKQKVVLCSPFTLYAMLSIVRQAHENFRFENNMKEIIKLIEQFSKIYDTFKGRFDDLGAQITKTELLYNDIKEKSFKNLDMKIRHIDDHKKGNMQSLSKDNLIELPNETRHDNAVL